MQPRRSFAPLIVVVAVIAAIVIGILYVLSLPFHLVNTTPSTASIATYTPTLDLNFNRELDNAKTATPVADQNIIRSSSVSGKTLTINLTSLAENKTYTITIAVVQAKDGSQIRNISLKFKPKYVPADKLPKSQQQTLLNNQDKNGPQPDPIYGLVPYSTLDFTLQAFPTADGKGIEVDANLLPSAADLSNEDQAIAQYKQEVVDYIKSKGLDPSKYTINYTVTQPTT